MTRKEYDSKPGSAWYILAVVIAIAGDSGYEVKLCADRYDYATIFIDGWQESTHQKRLVMRR